MIDRRKTIFNAGDVIAIITALASVFGAYYTLGTRVEANSKDISNINKNTADTKKDIINRLDKLESKIDRLIEQRGVYRNGN